MKLSDLLKGIQYKGGYIDKEISGVVCDSRKVTPGCVFVCIKGEKFDGHSYATQALNQGAGCVVTEKDLGLIDQIIVESTRLCYADMCAAFFGNPAEKLKLIGVTGTNGKTTVTTIIKHILTQVGNKVGLVGTIQNEIGAQCYPTDKTTPDAYELQRLFAQMVDAGCQYAVMEVSSHALDQDRLGSVMFQTAVFTNFTQDHLDYHKTMEAYFSSKQKLVSMAKQTIVNLDDIAWLNLCEPTATFSAQEPHATLFADQIQITPGGVSFILKCREGSYPVQFPTPGMFSVSNVLAAIGACRSLGLDIQQIVAAVNACKGVKGRCEVLDTHGFDFTVICDYAHSPDGLENILKSVKQYASGRMICLFGCGGDRDRTKRPIMGQIAGSYADLVVVTSDNPRSEQPDLIVADILEGIELTDVAYHVEVDRKKAIAWALEHAVQDDVIILAGKGHEDYQVLKDGKIHFDEREVVAEILDSMR